VLIGSLPEIALASLALLILVLYHIHLFYQVRTRPVSTSIGLTNRLRREWVQAVMEGKQDILAVQTLRNWVMASSFLASTAILIGLGILNAAFRTDKIAAYTQAINLFGSTSQAVWLIRLIVLVVGILSGFLNVILFFPSGAVYPIASFPQWLKTFAKINPEAYAVDALKGLLFKGADLASIATDIAFLLVFTIVMMTTAIMTFRRTL
jgi:ABC-type multidrug transport system permease subunit